MTPAHRLNIALLFFAQVIASFCLITPIGALASDYDYADEDEYEEEEEEEEFDYDYDYGAKPKVFEVSAYGWYVFSAAINAQDIT